MESKNNTSELIYEAEIDSQMQKTNLRLPGGEWGRGQLGDWDGHTHTTIYKIDQ